MTIGIIITLIILGILLLLIEFLVIPGVTVAGIAGTLMITGGIVAGYYYLEPPLGNYITISTISLIMLLFILAFKTKTWTKFGLEKSIDGHVSQAVSELYKVGETGKTISRLAPIGKIMIENKVVEARSMGGYIDTDTEIVIVKTEKNKIFVEPKTK